ncbi:hypothetical protein KK078_20175 [Fulvivirgaceae bacterium PWU37]|uniref:STAS/SEC14 domain-containing protein n=1 Tax=Dawidia soli TaxID=2782352 RepID=A0AAP2GEX5_9BACT|nr:hypothetical protein [Dawidia soli]
MLLYDASNVRIEYQEESGILVCVWIGFQTDEQIAVTGQVILDLIHERRITKILNDNREVIGLWADEWTRDVWFPKVRESGVKKFAWIFSENIFARMSARRAAIAGTTTRPLTIRDFRTTDAAMKWLLDV